MTDPKGTWSDGGKVWEGEPAVGGEIAKIMDDLANGRFAAVRNALAMTTDEHLASATPAVGGESLANKLDAHAIRYANDYGYGVATDLKEAAAALRAQSASPLREREPVAFMTKTALENWLRGSDPEHHVLLRQGSDMRVALYASPPEQPAADPETGPSPGYRLIEEPCEHPECEFPSCGCEVPTTPDKEPELPAARPMGQS